MRSGRTRFRAVVCSTLVGLLLIASAAFAQARFAQRRVGLAWVDGVPHISVSVRDLADDAVRRSLASGLRKHIVLTVQSYSASGDRLLASRELTCSITYDLWEDGFVVRSGRQSTTRASLSEVLGACLDLQGFPVGRASDYAALSGTRVYFAVRAEFNPITRARCGRLLGSAGSDDPIGPVVVNIVRREICQAERAVEFRSQAEQVP